MIRMRRIDFNEGWVIEGKEITLPHDRMLYEKRSANSLSSTGGAFYEGGDYIYEKNFDVPAEWKGKTIRLEFEGVYQNATVKINGQTAKRNIYGYTNFFVDCEPFLCYGTTNTITVEADNRKVPNSRWYSGAGIYRPVWLYVAEKTHIEQVHIRTTSIDPPAIEVVAAGVGDYEDEDVSVIIFDGDREVSRASGSRCDLILPEAVLWDEMHPKLYTCRVFLKNDIWEGNFGIRQLQWSSQGFFVNGKSVKLKGGCVHHDNGVLGACAYEQAEERRVRKIKEAGYNAVRSAHNPCSESFLRACDKYGLYLIDEMWDMWYERKNRFDYALFFMEHYAKDLKQTIERDRNHPSVIMYSVGNENLEPYDKKGLDMLQRLIDLCHEIDDTRPVTMGLNPAIVHGAKNKKGLFRENEEGKAGGSMLFNLLNSMFHGIMEKITASDSVGETIAPIIEKLDIVGYNYAEKRYEQDHERFPEKLFYGSETMPYHIARNWKLVTDHDYVCGDFCWTAWDYLGEAGLGSWSYRPEAAGFQKKFPWKLAEAGAIDLLGTEGAEAAYSGIIWDKKKKMRIMVTPPAEKNKRLHKAFWRGTNAVESWSFRGCDKKKCNVEVLGNGNRARLFVNGKKIGEKKMTDAKAVFKTVYESGKIEAQIFDADGNCVDQTCLISAKGKLLLRAVPEKADEKEEVLFVWIEVAGENEEVDFSSDRTVEIKVEGGTLLGFGSAQPCTTQRFVDGKYDTYQGRALAVIRRESKRVALFFREEGEEGYKIIDNVGD